MVTVYYHGAMSVFQKAHCSCKPSPDGCTKAKLGHCTNLSICWMSSAELLLNVNTLRDVWRSLSRFLYIYGRSKKNEQTNELLQPLFAYFTLVHNQNDKAVQTLPHSLWYHSPSELCPVAALFSTWKQFLGKEMNPSSLFPQCCHLILLVFPLKK